MELATGATVSLLPKLGELLSEEDRLLKDVIREVSSLQEEMASFEADVRKVAEVPRDQLDEQARLWASEVRELSYAMEDSMDRLMASIGDDSDRGDRGQFHGSVKKPSTRFSTLAVRHRIAGELENIKTRVQAVSDRRKRYMIDSVVADAVAVAETTFDPRLLDIYNGHAHLVGVQEAIDELIKRLLPDGGNNQQQLKILSILGPGGIGKTALATAVYERMRTEFDCTAIVSVGRNPKLARVFKDILFQIDWEKYSGITSSAEMDEARCIDVIRALLQNKRYFIMVDDIWDTQSWEIIRFSLMDCNFGSIIITTTRISDVAEKASDVYIVKPLCHTKSEELFYTRLFGDEVKLPGDQTTELVQKVLQRCGGVPLAITTIATLLCNKRKEDWFDFVDFERADIEVVKDTRKVILLSYYDLPSHLRVCLLHLSIFPRNYMVRKDTLIWKWVAEGFIQEESGVGLFEIGERYFNELINRCIIQPVEISHSGIIIGCRVNDMVLDILCCVAKENNFVTLLNGIERTTLKSNPRRLAVHGEVVKEQDPLAKTDMSVVRSFNAIRCDTTKMPSWVSFELLRVLAIEDCSSFQLEGNGYSLEHVGLLPLLRYMGLSKTHVRELPEEVGNLKFLEILDVRQTGIQELPQSVSVLTGLKCLRADGGSTRVPYWIGDLTSLEELSLDDVSSCPNFVKQISKLKELRELKIWVRVLDQRSKKALVKSLGSLQKIQVLHLDGGLWIQDADWEGYVPPRQLRRLSLRIKSSRLPRWINGSLLPKLSHLSVDVRVVEAEDLAILGSFQELITLELFMPSGVSLDVEGCGVLFPELRHCYASGMLRFLQGAGPRLESVHFSVMLTDLNGASFQCDSLENLPLLKEVRIEIFYLDVHGAAEVEKRLRNALGEHVNRPNLHVSKYKSYFDEQAAEQGDDSELEEDEEEDW